MLSAASLRFFRSDAASALQNFNIDSTHYPCFFRRAQREWTKHA